MSSEEIDIVAIVVPAPGKKERAQELLTALTEGVKEHEPEALRYQLHWQEEPGEFVMIEKYKNQAALDNHRNQDHYQNTVKRIVEEQLLAKPLELRFIKPVGGFAGR